MSISAWHFLPNDCRLANGDGRKIKPGSIVKIKGKPDLCNHGLHASTRLLDALGYAPGNILCRVSVSGDVVHGDDKLAGTVREVHWILDADWYLHEFACRVAEQCLKKHKVTDKRYWSAIATKRAWLDGHADDDDLSAAWGAARDAARDAAWGAARGAAWGAACGAACGAARGAAWGAARGAARGAACDAARGAAWGAAWGAARDSQNKMLTRLINTAKWT